MGSWSFLYRWRNSVVGFCQSLFPICNYSQVRVFLNHCATVQPQIFNPKCDWAKNRHFTFGDQFEKWTETVKPPFHSVTGPFDMLVCGRAEPIRHLARDVQLYLCFLILPLAKLAFSPPWPLVYSTRDLLSPKLGAHTCVHALKLNCPFLSLCMNVSGVKRFPEPQAQGSRKHLSYLFISLALHFCDFSSKPVWKFGNWIARKAKIARTCNVSNPIEVRAALYISTDPGAAGMWAVMINVVKAIMDTRG